MRRNERTSENLLSGASLGPSIVRLFFQRQAKGITMIERQAQTLAYNLMRQHNLYGWRLRFSNMKRTLGLCSYGKKEIALSRLYVSTGTEKEIEQTLLHEIAHALIGPRVKAHGYEWKRLARSIGVVNPKSTTKTNESFNDVARTIRAARTANYVINCPNCGIIGKAQRMGRRMRYGQYSCRKCGKTGLQWTRA